MMSVKEMTFAMKANLAAGLEALIPKPNWLQIGEGLYRMRAQPARPRAPHREPQRIQNAIIAAAGEKRMRRRQRPQGSTS